MSAPIGRVGASAPRRASAVAMLCLLGAILLWVGLFAEQGAPGWRVMLALMGGGAVALALALWRATERALVLTREVLREAGEGGRLVARVEAIESVSRGAFAFKPSNGFMLRLSEPGPRAWAPGLWWRIGRRVGVGGALRGAETRALAEAVAGMIAERDAAR